MGFPLLVLITPKLSTLAFLDDIGDLWASLFVCVGTCTPLCMFTFFNQGFNLISIDFRISLQSFNLTSYSFEVKEEMESQLMLDSNLDVG